MKSFEALFQKSIKAEKEFRFYIYAVFVLAIVFSFLVFLSGNQTFVELLHRENGMISIMYVLICTVLIASYIYLKSLHKNYFNRIRKDIGVLISMGMPRKKCKKLLIVKDLGPIMMADVAGSAVGFCIYAIVILHRILGRNENPFVQAFAGIFCIAVLSILFVCLMGIISNHRILNRENIFEIINNREGKIRRNIHGALQAGVGFFCLAVGNGVLIYNRISMAEHSNLLTIVSVCIACMGVYLTMLSFGYWICAALQRKERVGWNLILLNEIRNHYANSAKALSAYAIINWLLVFLTVIIVMLGLENQNLDTLDSPFDYVLEFGENQQEDMESFLLRQQDSIRECYKIPSVNGYAIYGDTEITMIPERSYQEIKGKPLNIKSGHAITLSQLDRSMVNITKEADGREWHYWPIDEEIPVDADGNKYSFITDYEIWEYLFNCEDPQRRIFILNDEDFNKAARENFFIDRLCINLRDNACLDRSTIPENIQLIGKWDRFFRIQKENRILIFSLVTMLVVLCILLLLTQHIQDISEKKRREKDYILQTTLGIERDGREKAREKSIQIKNFLPVLIGGLTGCMCTICFIKDMDIYLATLAFTVFLFECMMQFFVYFFESRFNF